MILRENEPRNVSLRGEQPQTPVHESGTEHPSLSRAATTTKAKARSRNLESENTSTLKSHRTKGLSGWTQQSTLTQIDFLQPSPQPPLEHDVSFDRIEEHSEAKSAQKDIEVIEIESSSSDKQQRDSLPPPPPSKKTHLSASRNRNGNKSVKFGSTSKKPARGRTKAIEHKNKTLTQMDFVRRIIVLDSDDEPNLDYINDNTKPQGNVKDSPSPTSKTSEEPRILEWPERRKRRKLSHGSSPVSRLKTMRPPSPKLVSLQTQDHQEPSRSSEQPKTPQKMRKLEIPSSQSPETPFAVRSSPPLKDAHQSPLRRFSKHRSPTPQSAATQLRERESQPQSSLLDSVKPKSGSLSCPKLDSQLDREVNPRIKEAFGKSVVYETDAESGDSEGSDPRSPDIGDFDEDQNDPTDGLSVYRDHIRDGSPDLPPQAPNSGTDLEGGDSIDGLLHSEASVYYRRPNLSTQFPLGPVPVLNTQRMAELFPPERDMQDESAGAPSRPRPSVQETPSDVLCPQSQSQTQSQDPAKISTDLVPESSPVAPGPYSNGPQSVVLVESSQPVDRINRRRDDFGHGSSGPVRLLSASYWLNDSAMESLPLPPGWKMSQDSVGEPYVES